MIVVRYKNPIMNKLLYVCDISYNSVSYCRNSCNAYDFENRENAKFFKRDFFKFERGFEVVEVKKP